VLDLEDTPGTGVIGADQLVGDQRRRRLAPDPASDARRRHWVRMRAAASSQSRNFFAEDNHQWWEGAALCDETDQANLGWQ